MRVCVIGAGPSGLCAAKEVREANPGCEIEVYEGSSGIGGTFATSYEGLTLVNNPLLISFSDFLATERLDNLRMWTAEEYVAYLKRYADHNELWELIHFDTRVTDAVYQHGEWRVTTSKGGTSRVACFDHLVVCSGSNSKPNVPVFPNQQRFTGEIIHSQQIRKPSDLKGRRVVYVGLGETGSDLAYLCAPFAESGVVSLRRRPGYLIPRYHDGRPTDLDTSKIYHSLPKHLDGSVLSGVLKFKRWLERCYIRSKDDGEIQAVADRLNASFAEGSACGPFRRASTKSCGFVRAHIAGTVGLKPGIADLDGREVRFSDGTATLADVIVCCTGYRQDFPFLDASAAPANSSNALYEYMFDTRFREKLAFIGFVRPGVGTVPAISELQGRYLGLILNGTITLPGADAMCADVKRQREVARATFPLDFDRLPQLVDYYPYLMGLAKKMRILPVQSRHFLADPRLWYKANFAFLCPAIFRLHGPGAKVKLVAPTLRALPTMPLSILFLEALLHLGSRLLPGPGIGAARTRS